MKTSRPAAAALIASICFRSEMVCTPAIGSDEPVSTMIVRLGSGLPMVSKVLRPITMMWPVVICLNHLKSSGKCHGILLPAPITRLSDMAAMAFQRFIQRGDCRIARGPSTRGGCQINVAHLPSNAFASVFVPETSKKPNFVSPGFELHPVTAPFHARTALEMLDTAATGRGG